LPEGDGFMKKEAAEDEDKDRNKRVEKGGIGGGGVLQADVGERVEETDAEQCEQSELPEILSDILPLPPHRFGRKGQKDQRCQKPAPEREPDGCMLIRDCLAHDEIACPEQGWDDHDEIGKETIFF